MLVAVMLAAAVLVPNPVQAGRYTLTVSGDQLLLNGKQIKIIGLRTSNALVSDSKTDELIANLPVFKSYGVNTVSVFFMGSRFGDVRGYRPDGSLNPACAARMGRIIEAADRQGMIVLVGCLYWSNSQAKQALVGVWTQAHANLAVANTVRWLRNHEYRNVFVDPDNEGMARDANGWSIAEMIDAGHAVDPKCLIGYNEHAAPPGNADLYLHHSSKVSGKPWVQSEGSPSSTPGGYWGSYSKENGYYNYIRIGRYSEKMKAVQIGQTKSDVENHGGYVLASTWLQCAPSEGVGGPFMTPGGPANCPDVDEDIKTLQSDAGILWWLKAIQQAYGPWLPPP